MMKSFPTMAAFRVASRSMGFTTPISMYLGLWAVLLVVSTPLTLLSQSALLAVLLVTPILLISAFAQALLVERSWAAWREYSRITTPIGQAKSTDCGGEELF